MTSGVHISDVREKNDFFAECDRRVANWVVLLRKDERKFEVGQSASKISKNNANSTTTEISVNLGKRDKA